MKQLDHLRVNFFSLLFPLRLMATFFYFFDILVNFFNYIQDSVSNVLLRDYNNSITNETVDSVIFLNNFDSWGQRDSLVDRALTVHVTNLTLIPSTTYGL